MGSPSHKNILLKAILLGDGGVGKSCLMNRFVSNRFDSTSFHTIGVEFLNKQLMVNGEQYTVQIWDTAGQERFKSLRTPFYRGSDICLLTFAICDKLSFQSLQSWREEFLYYADITDKQNFPFVVLGNKVDLEGERAVAQETVLEWCASHGNLPYVETSAKEATNVPFAFQSAVERWRRVEGNGPGLRRDTRHTVNLPSSSRGMVQQSGATPTSRPPCC